MDIISTSKDDRNFSILSDSSDESSIDAVTTMTLRKPLVAMIAVGDYPKSNRLGPLIGAPNDYKNMIKLFVQHWGYSFLYQTSNNKFVCLDGNSLFLNNNMYQNNFKLKWTCDEIDLFIFKSKQLIYKLLSDGIIFIISSHGGKDSALIDSHCEEYPLWSIFYQFWNCKGGCPYLANKPKLFFIDLCRGSRKPTPSGYYQRNMINIGQTKGGNNTITIDNKKSTNMGSSSSIGSSSGICSIHDTEFETKLQKTDECELSKANPKCLAIRLQSVEETMCKKFLQNENFSIIYSNLKHYAVVDGGKYGSYLLRSLKHVLKQKNAWQWELNEIISYIRNETLRLVKGEKKKSKLEYNKPDSYIRHIVDYQSCIAYDLYFGKFFNCKTMVNPLMGATMLGLDVYCWDYDPSFGKIYFYDINWISQCPLEFEVLFLPCMISIKIE